MRISDWSSDVCSSDLGDLEEELPQVDPHRLVHDRDEEYEPWTAMPARPARAEDDQSLILPHYLDRRRQDEDTDDDERDHERQRQIGSASCRERVCTSV